MPGEESDERLMRRFRGGDASAFEALVRRHRRPVHAFLSRLLGDRGRAEDLLQETWLRVVAAAPRWEERALFRTWLFTVARNLAADEARRKAFRGSPVPLEAPDPERRRSRVPEPVADDPPPDHLAEGALLRGRLEEAVAQLPEEQREVFVLRELADVPFAEIAAITGAPLPTVKSRMRYALDALRRRLGAMGLGPEGAAPGSGGGRP